VFQTEIRVVADGLIFVFLGDGRVEDKKEGDEERWGKST